MFQHCLVKQDNSWRCCSTSTRPSYILDKESSWFFGLVQPKWLVRSLSLLGWSNPMWIEVHPASFPFVENESLECTLMPLEDMQNWMHQCTEMWFVKCWNQLCCQNYLSAGATSFHSYTAFWLVLVDFGSKSARTENCRKGKAMNVVFSIFRQETFLSHLKFPVGRHVRSLKLCLFLWKSKWSKTHLGRILVLRSEKNVAWTSHFGAKKKNLLPVLEWWWKIARPFFHVIKTKVSPVLATAPAHKVVSWWNMLAHSSSVCSGCRNSLVAHLISRGGTLSEITRQQCHLARVAMKSDAVCNCSDCGKCKTKRKPVSPSWHRVDFGWTHWSVLMLRHAWLLCTVLLRQCAAEAAAALPAARKMLRETIVDLSCQKCHWEKLHVKNRCSMSVVERHGRQWGSQRLWCNTKPTIIFSVFQGWKNVPLKHCDDKQDRQTKLHELANT